MDKAIDMGPIVDESQRRTIEEYVEGARAEGAEVFQVQLDKVPGKRSAKQRLVVNWARAFGGDQ